MRLISINSLKDGMLSGQDLYDEHNRLLLRRGSPIKGVYIGRLKKMGLKSIYVQDKDTSDISAPQLVSTVSRTRAVQSLSKTFEDVSKSIEPLRQVSIQEAHNQVRSKKFMDTFKSLVHNENAQKILNAVDLLIDQLMSRDVILGLNSIKMHDSYTFQHSIDVTIMALLLARKTGWSKERLRVFGIGCFLHDMGKVFIDDEILNKPGKLTDEEFERMKAHPTLGYELIKTMSPKLGYLIPHVAYQHHERQDGSGYPRGLVGHNTLGENAPNTIHDFGAICAVADIYDAMASDRPYRQGWPPDRVVDLIRSLSGTHLNSKVVDIFLRTVAPYPMGTGIKVLNGQYANYEGVVADVHNLFLDRPDIRLLFNDLGERTDAIEIDLREEEDIRIESVREGEPELEPLGSSRKSAVVEGRKQAHGGVSQAVESEDIQSPSDAETAAPSPRPPQASEQPAPSTDGKKICDGCKHPNEPGTMFCRNCGALLPEDSPEQAPETAAQPDPAPTAAPSPQQTQASEQPAPSTDGKKICDGCKHPNEPGTMFCRNCGALLPEIA